MKRFTVVLTPDLESGGFTAVVPTLPDCVSNGETVENALERVQDAISLYLQDESDLISVESPPGFQVLVAEVAVA